MPADPQYQFWNAAFAGPQFYYGFEPGPVARRAARYHRPLWKTESPSALDIGCGEGQDLMFLAQTGYDATGLEWTPSGADKARRLLENNSLKAEVVVSDWREYSCDHTFDLVLAVNALQFMGEGAAEGLDKTIAAVAPQGVLGLSLFEREENEERLRNGVAFFTMPELLARFDYQGENRQWQMLETARLWQWNRQTNAPQPFITLVAQRIK